MDRDPDRARLVRERPGDRLADPPGGVGRELEASALVELLRGADESEGALLDQERETAALGRDSAWRSRPPAAGSTRPSSAWPRTSPARSAWREQPPPEPSATAPLPMPFRNSCRPSVVPSGSRSSGALRRARLSGARSMPRPSAVAGSISSTNSISQRSNTSCSSSTSLSSRPSSAVAAAISAY